MRPNSIAVQCQTCGTTFMVQPARLAKGRGKYCGQPCRDAAYTGSVKSPLSQRFWSKVGDPTTTGCREWQAARDRSGYGRLSSSRGSSPIKAHRLAYEFSFGKIPVDMDVCHHCDNPPCCNPEHLFLGDAKANAIDMVQKGRAAFGERNGAYTHPERHSSRLFPQSRPRDENHWNWQGGKSR